MVVCTRGAVRGPECIPSGDSRLVIEGTNLFVKWLSAADKEGCPGMGKLRPGGHIRPVKLFNLARQTWKILYFYIIVNLVLFSLQFTLYSTIDLCWGVVDYSTFAIHSLILQILQMSGAKKRDVDSECRVFNKEWTINFFFFHPVMNCHLVQGVAITLWQLWDAPAGPCITSSERTQYWKRMNFIMLSTFAMIYCFSNEAVHQNRPTIFSWSGPPHKIFYPIETQFASLVDTRLMRVPGFFFL